MLKFSKVLEKKEESTTIIRFGADIAPKCRNESNSSQVKSAQIFKCYGLENVGARQIGILFTFSGGIQFIRCTGRIARDIRHCKWIDDGNVPGEQLTLLT